MSMEGVSARMSLIPIGMGRAAYQEVAKTLDAAIPAIIAYIDQTSGKE